MNPWRQSSAMVGRFFGRPAALLFILLTVGLAWPRAAPAAGNWSETGRLATARYAHTATLLADGKVLVAGGEGPGGYLASAELFNPADGTWSTTGPLATARYIHTATLLPNGKVLVAGGYNGGSLASAELFDPATGTWSSPGPLSTARRYHTATLLANGRVLVAGGYDGANYFASAELFNPADGTWSTTGPLATARYIHTATLLPNGKVLAAGGWGALASAELFKPDTGTWTGTGALNTARIYHLATLLADGRVLVAGGNDDVNELTSAELYDPQNYISNGSFEKASVAPGVGGTGLDSGSNAITGWQVGTGGGVDYRGNWQSAEGNRCLDLNYLDAGSIMQSFSASKGKRYLVTFALAGNPGGVQGVKTLRVSVGRQSQEFTFDTTGKTTGDMGWTSKSWSFKATDVSPILQFRSLTEGTIGPALDKVRVIRIGSVPLPLLLLD